MLNAPVLPLLLRLASPNAAAFLVQASVSMTEVWFVGQLGTVSLAAMALMFPWLMLMQMLANGAMGGAVTGAIARSLGAGEVDQAERLIWHALGIAVAAGLVFLVLVLTLLDPMLATITPDAAVIEQAQRYALILFTGCPLLWMMAVLSSVFRGMGNMRFPALLMMASASIQVPLSGTLILGWFGLPSLGIGGAAVSVIVTALLSTLVLAWSLRRADSRVRLRTDRLQLRRHLFGIILRVGLPSSLSPVFTVATISGINLLVGGFGVAALAGYGIGSRIEFLLIPLVFGLGVSMNTLVGVNLGAGQLRRAVRIGWIGGATAALTTGVIGVSVALVPELWAGLFSDDRATIEAARSYLRLVGPFFAFQGLGLSLFFASQGAGTVAWPVTATFIRLVIAVGGGAVAVHAFGTGLNGLFVVVGLAMLVFGTVTATALKFGVWDKANSSVTTIE